VSSKLKSNSGAEPQGTSTQPEKGEVSVGNSARAEEIRRRTYVIYLECGEQPGGESDVGSKPNANSKVRCLGRRARKLICYKAEEDR